MLIQDTPTETALHDKDGSLIARAAIEDMHGGYRPPVNRLYLETDVFVAVVFAAHIARLSACGLQVARFLLPVQNGLSEEDGCDTLCRHDHNSNEWTLG